MPSVQLTNYLQARADGATVEDAAEQSGIGLGEAVLHEADIESGELELPRAMPAANGLPSQEELRQLLDFDPETGKLFWRARTVSMFERSGVSGAAARCAAWNARYAGKPTLGMVHPHGYFYGDIFGRRFFAHRVMFKLVHGYEPPLVDHINGDKTDNRIANLRAATPTESARNAARPKCNKSGVVGVSFSERDGKWVAFITLEGRRQHIGLFPTMDEAVEARRRAEAEHGFHPNHGREPVPRAPTRAHERAREGHQSGEKIMAQDNIAADELRLFIERIDRLDEERKGLADDIRDVYAEAKSRGFDTWAMKEIRKWRRLETHTRQERAALLELYAQALGVTVADAEILKAA